MQVIFQGAKTTPDGGWRLTFDVSNDEATKVVQIVSLKDLLLQMAVVPIEVSNAG